MGKRTTSRKIAMQALYQSDISGITTEEAICNLTGENPSGESVKFASLLVNGTVMKMSDIDSRITSYSKEWPVQRMSVLDRNILRLAFYELLFEKDTPAAVVASEAVELAKKYSGTDSSRFINGILGAFIKDVKSSGK